MTVSTTTNKVAYIGNGVATSFAIPFPFLEEEHLKVYQLLNDIQTERADWSLSNGNMVFETAPENGAQIVIILVLPPNCQAEKARGFELISTCAGDLYFKAECK